MAFAHIWCMHSLASPPQATRKKASTASELAAEVALRQSHSEGKHLPSENGDRTRQQQQQQQQSTIKIPGLDLSGLRLHSKPYTAAAAASASRTTSPHPHSSSRRTLSSSSSGGGGSGGGAAAVRSPSRRHTPAPPSFPPRSQQYLSSRGKARVASAPAPAPAPAPSPSRSDLFSRRYALPARPPQPAGGSGVDDGPVVDLRPGRGGGGSAAAAAKSAKPSPAAQRLMSMRGGGSSDDSDSSDDEDDGLYVTTLSSPSPPLHPFRF